MSKFNLVVGIIVMKFYTARLLKRKFQFQQIQLEKISLIFNNIFSLQEKKGPVQVTKIRINKLRF